MPVFASVAEYESSLAGVEDEADSRRTAPAQAPTVPAPAAPPVPRRKLETPDSNEAAESDGTLGLVVPAAAVAGGATASSLAEPPGDTIRTTIPRGPSPYDERGPAAPTKRPERSPRRAAGTEASWRDGVRTPWLIGGAILALALLVGGIGVYLLLPSAHIVVTPRQEPLGPIQVVITADTTANQPDATALVVPAKQASVPVSVQDTFNATGKRVELANATGTVRFENLDPTASNRIASGSVVRTASGIRFRTAVTIVVPRAELVGLTIFPARASVKVTAVDGGPGGNVDPNTIVVVPSGENPLFLKVTNPEATSGGTRTEFTRVTQADVTGAMTALDTSLHQKFAEALADPSLTVNGATVFDATATLGTTTPSLDPATLVGQEIPTFDLGLSATGTVITADTTPVKGIAETQLRSAVKGDHQIVAGSVAITVGEAIVSGQTVTVPVTATAKQIAVLDPATLKAQVLGRSVADAKAILAPYGDVALTVSPDWTGSVPSFESRVDLTIQQAVPIETPSPSGSSAP